MNTKTSKTTKSSDIKRLEDRMTKIDSDISELKQLLIGRKEDDLEKANITLKSRAVDDIIENFDFNRVASVMESLDWEWYDPKIQKSIVPSADKIKEMAIGMLHDAWAGLDITPYDASGWKEYMVSTGGLEAWVAENGKDVVKPERYVKLRFILEEWDVEPGD